MEYAIETHSLSKQYGQIRALDKLDLQVPKNSIFGFLGPNGAGKSTTIKLLLGLIHPTAGTAQIAGKDIQQESLAVRRRIGYLAQHPRFYPFMTAREVLRLSGSFFIQEQGRLEARVEDMLDLVGLNEKADRKIGAFSGGETQRLGIAQAQIHNPPILILDEPAAALDPMGRERVLEIMEQLRSQSTIFFSTHILDDVQRISDHVAILSQGKLVAQAPTDQLLASGGAGAYRMTTRGGEKAISEQLAALEWVQGTEKQAVADGTHWRILVDDEARADDELLRAVLAEPTVQVLEFGRQHAELEEIFVQLVNGGK